MSKSSIMNNGIYRTKTTEVIISDNHVTKKFLPGSYKRRIKFNREAKALSRMAEVEHVPKLIHADRENFLLVMTRLTGQKPRTLSVNNVIQLRNIVQRMIKAGVARHSIPIRDIIVDNDDQLSLVDFERISLRLCKFSPFWQIACIVTKYHMYRLIAGHQPNCLSRNETTFFLCIHSFRSMLQPLKKLKDIIGKLI